MGIVPNQWYEKLNNKDNVNPFTAVPSIQKEYSLSFDKTATETKLLRKTHVETDSDFYSLENEHEFEFYDLKAESNSLTKQWAGKGVLFIGRL
jgi:hypothetical protein